MVAIIGGVDNGSFFVPFRVLTFWRPFARFPFYRKQLLIVSVITNLTVEGIKKLLDGTKVKYSSNVLAAILSVLIACAVSVIYLIMTDTVFTMKIGVEIVVLMYLGFLISTVGYDKVIQMLKQIQSVKEETKNE